MSDHESGWTEGTVVDGERHDNAVDPIEAYANSAARTMLDQSSSLHPSARLAFLHSVMDRIDPTLFRRASAYGLNQRGIARALHEGLITELQKKGRKVGLGATTTLLNIVGGQPIATAPQHLAAIETYWPYQPSPGETILQIGEVATIQGGGISLPNVLTLPTDGTLVQLTSLPDEYQYLIKDLDVASTFFEGTYARGSRTSGGCPQGTRWGPDGISLEGSVPGISLPTVDGGHPVPFLEALLTDPQTSTFPVPACASGDDTCQKFECLARAPRSAVYTPGFAHITNAHCTWPGLPLYVFLFPDTADVWGIFVTTTHTVLDPAADTYVPPAWRDKAGNIVERERATNLFLRARKLTAEEFADYNDDIKFASQVTGCTFDPFADFKNIGGLLKAGLKIAIDLATAVAQGLQNAACGMMQNPGATAAAAKSGGPYAAAGVAAVGATCPNQPQCPPGFIKSATGCVAYQPPSKSPLPLILAGAGGVLVIALLAKKSKEKPA